MGGDGARGKDWLRARMNYMYTCVLQTQFSSFFRGGVQGNIAIYFKGVLENNSLF